MIILPFGMIKAGKIVTVAVNGGLAVVLRMGRSSKEEEGGKSAHFSLFTYLSIYFFNLKKEFFFWKLKRKKKRFCTGRDSNSDRPRGRRAFYP